MQIKYCKKCVFPETKPDLSFNEEGVCSACVAAEDKDKGIDWEERKSEFFKIVESCSTESTPIGIFATELCSKAQPKQ